MKENQLDAIDVRILEELTADARIPFVQLSKKLNDFQHLGSPAN